MYLIERWGRKKLLVWGGACMSISLLLVTLFGHTGESQDKLDTLGIGTSSFNDHRSHHHHELIFFISSPPSSPSSPVIIRSHPSPHATQVPYSSSSPSPSPSAQRGVQSCGSTRQRSFLSAIEPRQLPSPPSPIGFGTPSCRNRHLSCCLRLDSRATYCGRGSVQSWQCLLTFVCPRRRGCRWKR